MGNSSERRIVNALRANYFLLGNASFYLFFGAVIGIVYMLIIESEISQEHKEYWTYGITALVTLLASGTALVGVFFDIKNSNINEEERRIRELSGAKALLPLALTEICEIARRGMYFCRDFRDDLTAAEIEELKSRSFTELSLADETKSILRDFIRYSRDDDGKKVSLILQEYQVFLSRWRGSFEENSRFRNNNNGNRTENISSWAYLYALSSHIYDHARGETENIEPLEPHQSPIETALRLAVIPYNDDPEFVKAIKLYHRRLNRKLD